MTPTRARLDAGNSVWGDSVVCGDEALQPIVGSNRYYLSGTELGCPAALPTIGSSVRDSVSHVVYMKVPSQIAESIVLRVAIVVATFAAFWCWANKSDQDQSMNTRALEFVVLPKKKHEPFAIPSWLLKAHRSSVAHIAEIGHIIESFKTNNRFPYFHPSNYPAHESMVQG